MPGHLTFLCLAALAWAQPQNPWTVHEVHPWIEATPDELAANCGHPTDSLRLAGPRNDWLHTALVIKCSGRDPQRLTLSLQAPHELRDHVQLRVVGFVKHGKDQWAADPLFEKVAASPYTLSHYLRNYEAIRNFPQVTATPRDPVMLWITVKTHGLKPGTHEARLVLEGEDGKSREIGLEVRVWAWELQGDNPLIGFGWQWTAGGEEKLRWLRWFKDYGINCTHIDFEAARQVGYRFFLFTFNPSWGGKPVGEVPAAEIMQALDGIRQMVEKLDLKPEEWAVQLQDEPNDDAAPRLVEWARHLRTLWPQFRFWFNPAWGPGPTNTWATNPGTFEPLAEFADVWCPYSHHLWDPQQPLAVMRRTGKPIWFYEILGMSYSRRPDVGRSMLRLGPWLCWKYRLQGFAYYALDEYSDTDPWSDQTARYTYAIVYPPLIAGRGLEAVRHGFQDYKRLLLLQQLGCPTATLDAWAERVIGAKSVAEIDAVRAELDEAANRLVESAGRP